MGAKIPQPQNITCFRSGIAKDLRVEGGEGHGLLTAVPKNVSATCSQPLTVSVPNQLG